MGGYVTNELSDEIAWSGKLPFMCLHLGCLAAFWTGVSWKSAALCVVCYAVRMFGITAGYHRYFAHRSYKTSRWFQFVLAVIGSLALQKGVLWWAAHHRHHHQHSDEHEDVHSPSQRGFWWSHAGWFLCTRYDETRFDLVKDLAVYPELRWLNRHERIPGILLAVGCFLLLGWQGLVWGFFISTVLLYHGTFAINSLCHIFGSVRYDTGDDSRNSFVLALITFGEGWHNNHHYYSSCTRMGFRWWEIDLSYYGLRVLTILGFVWDLRMPPLRVLRPVAVVE